MKWVLCTSLLFLVLLVSCSSQSGDNNLFDPPKRHELPTDAMLSACSSNADCVPLPSQCHPTRCINKEYRNSYKSPDVCTEIFVLTAAYDQEDCGCVQNTCVNLNADRTVDDLVNERYYCEPTALGSDCIDEYQPVCGFDVDDQELRTFSNSCEACNDGAVSSWILGEC
jgi:hypothetical protein